MHGRRPKGKKGKDERVKREEIGDIQETEIFKFSYYANLATDDVIGCASTLSTYSS